MVGDKKNYGVIAFKTVLVLLLAFFFLLPLWLVFTSAFTKETAWSGYSMWVPQFSLDAFVYVFNDSDVMRALLNTVLVSVSTVVLSMAVNTLTAYVLHRKDMPGHKALNLLFVITMFFSAGMIPTFLVINAVGLYDTIWALILPPVLSVYNVLLIRNYFYSVPASLSEAAQIDGASHMRVLLTVLVPVAKPVIITTALISFVTKWNSWMDVLLYLGPNSRHLWTVQYVVRQMLENFNSYSSDPNAPVNTLKNATIVVTILPLIVLFPIFQKYFANGITLGSVKG